MIEQLLKEREHAKTIIAIVQEMVEVSKTSTIGIGMAAHYIDRLEVALNDSPFSIQPRIQDSDCD